MEDFREIVGFLIIGIGILFSILKERKGKNSSDSPAPTQNTPIQRKPQNQSSVPPPSERLRPGRLPQTQPRPIQTAPEATSGTTTSLPFVLSSVADRVRHHQSQPRSSKSAPKANVTSETSGLQTNTYESLPEEGARVTKDVEPMEPISDYNAQEEEEFIEKLRQGIILSEILQRKF